MLRISLTLAALAALMTASPAASQSVEVTPLAAPDAFSVPGRQTGLPQDLWRGASAETARAVLPKLAAQPLSPAAAALARRVLATGAPGPDGAGPDLAGLRASALLAQGDAQAAAAILERTSSLERSTELSKAAAESALLANDKPRACAVAEGLGVGRDDVYWLRLRTYCLAQTDRATEAQLTFDLAQAQAKDPIFTRLMAAKLAGGAATGAASLRNGLDLALSRDLGLDLSKAQASPAVAAALAGGEPQAPTWDFAALPQDIGGVASLVAAGQSVPEGALNALIGAAGEADAKSAPRLQAAVLLLAALSPQLSPDDRARLAGYAVPPGKTPAGRDLALDDAADHGLMGETALLALWTAAEAGAPGLGIADRARTIRALVQVGLEADARALAVEGLAALK